MSIAIHKTRFLWEIVRVNLAFVYILLIVKVAFEFFAVSYGKVANKDYFLASNSKFSQKSNNDIDISSTRIQKFTFLILLS